MFALNTKKIKIIYPAIEIWGWGGGIHFWTFWSLIISLIKQLSSLKPQDSFGRFVKKIIDLQKVDHTIRKHH